MSLSDRDRLYSDSDAIDAEAYEELVTALRPTCPPPLPKPNGLALFRSLGVNVIRLLLTYFNLQDFMRVTATSRWLYGFGTDPVLLSQYVPVLPATESEVTLRMCIVNKWREQALITRKRELKVDVVLDPQLVQVIHAAVFYSRVVLFSLSGGRLIVWECVKSTPKIIWNCEGVANLQHFTIVPEGAALLGTTQVVNIAHKWLYDSYQSKHTYRLSLPFNAQSGHIYRAKGALWVAVAVRGNITVYTEGLEQLYYFPCSLPYDWSSVLLAPSAQGLLFVLPTHWQVYNLNKGLVKQYKTPLFSTILQADVLTVPCEGREKLYIITLGYTTHPRLYANRQFLLLSVNSFKILNQLLIVSHSSSNFTVYKAGIDRVQVLSTLKPTFPYHSFHATSSHIVAINTTTRQHWDGQRYWTDYALKVGFLSYEGAVFHTQILENVSEDSVFAFRSEVIITGKHYQLACGVVRIVRYLLDETGKPRTLDQMCEECKQTWVPSVLETNREHIWLQRRLAKRDKRAGEKELERKKRLKYWKTKLLQYSKRAIKLEIDTGLLESSSNG